MVMDQLSIINGFYLMVIDPIDKTWLWSIFPQCLLFLPATSPNAPTFGRSTALGCKCCVQSCHIGGMVLPQRQVSIVRTCTDMYGHVPLSSYPPVN